MDEQIVSLIDNYQPNPQAVALVRRVPKVLIAGISGAGKNSTIDKLLETKKFHFIVSHTTRKPRKNNGVMEKDKTSFHFIDFNQVIKMLKNHEFVEVKWVHRHNIYGTAVSEFQKISTQDKTAIADVDIGGVEEYMKLAPETTKPIFILPPSFDIWQQRFQFRYQGHAGEDDLKTRLHSAVQEIEHVLSKSYFSIVINDDLDNAVTQVQAIVNGELQSGAERRYGFKVAHELLEAMRAS